MRKLTSILLAAALTGFLLQGCSSLLFKSTPAPVYFQLDYGPVKAECRKGFHQGVRVTAFGASHPYDQKGMVVVEGERADYSGSYQWVAPPGRLVADSLVKDLDAGKLFREVAGPGGSVMVALELTGRIFTFSWEKGDSGYRARLRAEVSLIDTSAKDRVILRKGYELASGPYQENTPDNFAKAMSSVTAEFSKALQKDLCGKAGEGRR